ncbi:MAG: efflux RND transporter periplasmic adaptor subunit [Gammaproteobacteria bacterium]|nr:efflux RND transporter periplasmic adaptor subunit [Gammaproteobacteria bacterium]MDG2435139.1 efflux RND transporter periplasmic adaptor subunit [Gammaproteobacteria bacterium]
MGQKFKLIFFFIVVFSSSQSLLAQITISTTAVSSIDLTEEESVMGMIYSRASPSLAAEVSGRVIEILADIGDEVDKGQVLAKIDPEKYTLQFAQSKAEMARLSALLINQELDLKRAEQLFKDSLVSEEMIDRTRAEYNALKEQINAAEAQLNNSKRLIEETEIKAPIKSKVSAKNIDVGDFVQTGVIVFELVDTENLRVALSFPEYQNLKLKKGLSVYLTTPTSIDQLIETTIKDIKPDINANSRSITAIVDFENPGSWVPGASTQATIILSTVKNALVLPQLSVVRRSNGNVVYLLNENTVLERSVNTGLEKNGLIQITSGLRKGDIVALDGAGFLTNGSVININND